MSSEPMSVADAKQLVRDVFHQAQRDASKLRNGAIEIALGEFERAVRESAPATPAATPLAVDPSAGDRLMATARTALAEQLYAAADKCNIRIVPFDEEGVERVAWNADWNRFADAIAMNESAPQNLPAAAQPQRESEDVIETLPCGLLLSDVAQRGSETICNGPFGDEEACPVHGAEIRKARGRESEEPEQALRELKRVAEIFAARVQERNPEWFRETGTDFAEADHALRAALSPQTDSQETP